MRFEDEMAHPCIFFGGETAKYRPLKKLHVVSFFSLRSSMALTSKRRDFFLRDAHRTPRKKHLNYLENLVSECCPFCVKKWVVGSWMEVGPWFMIQTHFFWISVKFQGCDSEMMQRCSPEPAAHLGYGNPGERGTSRVSQPTNLLPETSNFSWWTNGGVQHFFSTWIAPLIQMKLIEKDVYDIFIHIGIYEYMAWIVFNSSKDARWWNQIPGKAENQLPASPCWRLQGHFYLFHQTAERLSLPTDSNDNK